VYFGRAEDGILESPFSGNLAEVCPTGVFTDKTLKQHYTRKWDLTSAASVCQNCSLGCNIFASERYGKLRCITNRYNGEVNGYFLCDRGRFGYEFVNSENRVTQPLLRTLPVEAVSEETLLDHLVNILPQKNLVGIGSARASMESNFSLRQLVGKDNFYQGISGAQAALEGLIAEILVSGGMHSCSMKDIEQADAVLVLGEDAWNTAPMLALAVRQAVMKTAAAQATQQVPLSSWNDAAVKELVQEKKGYLAVLAVAGSPLEEIATTVDHAAPDDLARLGFAIAGILQGTREAVPGLDEKTLKLAVEIAETLQHAHHPVIISGTSCYNEAIIKAAYQIAAALNNEDRKAGLTYVLPDCNSLGLAMMQAPSLDKALERLQTDNDSVVIILEQDIYRSLPPDKADEFFRLCGHVVVLDALHSRTTGKAHVLVPAATFAEADGTLVNNEGRAQRFFQVFVPANNYIKESWRWLGLLAERLAGNNDGKVILPEVLLAKLEQEMPVFSGITGVSPSADFRILGQLIPREPHRYSGRTAILANLQVSEPKPRSDADSPLSFTMEGYNGLPPSSTTPFYWAPGWNSSQSVHKYQVETGGALKGGDPGVRLINDNHGKAVDEYTGIPQAFRAVNGQWLLLPKYHLFGSGELSVYTNAISELSPDPAIIISTGDAAELKVTNGTVARLRSGNVTISLPVQIRSALANGIVLVSKGLPGMDELNWGEQVTIDLSAEALA
jgi:NADH-quinone oxidoreductase subunit G